MCLVRIYINANFGKKEIERIYLLEKYVIYLTKTAQCQHHQRSPII